MKLSTKQAKQIKNLVAFIFCNVDYDIYGKDKSAFQAADIPSRADLNTLIKQIRLEVSND